jgi:hypothetical protein
VLSGNVGGSFRSNSDSFILMRKVPYHLKRVFIFVDYFFRAIVDRLGLEYRTVFWIIVDILDVLIMVTALLSAKLKHNDYKRILSIF